MAKYSEKKKLNRKYTHIERKKGNGKKQAKRNFGARNGNNGKRKERNRCNKTVQELELHRIVSRDIARPTETKNVCGRVAVMMVAVV